MHLIGTPCMFTLKNDGKIVQANGCYMRYYVTNC
jgi:hypothetical protein